MQGRAAAVYGLVFLLVAAGAFAYVTVAEPPEPSMDNPDVTFSGVGDNATIADRTYNLQGFDSQRGQPTATLNWTDDDARSTASWSHAAEPSGTTVTTGENVTYWVRIPQTPAPSNFTLLESPAEDSNVSVITGGDDNWIVNDNGTYTDLANYGAFERIVVENGSTLTNRTDDGSREVRVEEITNESVTVSWNEPAVTEVVVRQTSRRELNGQNATPHIPGDGSLEIATSEAAIEEYLAAHQDRRDFQTRMDGLRMASVISLVSFVLLIGMAFMPRKE